MTRLQKAEQFRRTVQLFADSLDENIAMEIATVYDAWEEKKEYKAGKYLTYGENSVGDPQLYRVVKNHTSQADWPPYAEPSLYKPIGLDEDGYPVWSPPTGEHDAYDEGDIVDHEGILYESKINGNTTVPGSDERWWKVYEG